MNNQTGGVRGSTRFWDKIAKRYARTPIADESAYQRKLEMTQALLRPDMSLFEFGCGTGSTALAHASCVDHIEATDLSPEMIRIAQEKADAAGVTNVTFTAVPIEQWIPPEDGYDMVLGLSILHLVEDRMAVLAKVHQMLKPGGLFISSTACLKDSMAWFGLIAPLGKALGLLPTVRIFTASALAQNIQDAGFVIDENWHPGRGKAVFIIARKT
ncbi:MAG: methyltransferase domain-containing protein [Pseudomonadota bacterium]